MEPSGEPMAEETKKEVVRWFKSPNRVGEIRLLPTNIDNRVLIRKPKMDRSGGHGSCHHFSVVCMLNPGKRTINMMPAWNSKEDKTRGIDIPKLIFQYDFNSLELDQDRNVGYLYRPTTDEGNLSEILKSIKAFRFRPHVYVDAYMCLMNKRHDSMRVLNNVFWDSNFRDDGEPFEEQLKMEEVAFDGIQQGTLDNYTDFFEVDKKPAGIFFSSNPRVLAKAKNGVLPGKDYVVGFAWLVKNRWWAYLKDGVFMRFYPEQVKVI